MVYLVCVQTFEPLEEKEKVHARILKPSDIRKIKLLGNGVFGSVHKVIQIDLTMLIFLVFVFHVPSHQIVSTYLTFQGIWVPEGDTVKLPVAIKTIQDRTGRQTFCQVTDVSMVLKIHISHNILPSRLL